MSGLYIGSIRFPNWGARMFNPLTSSILLYGFDVGKHTLQSEHKNVLDQYAALVRKGTTDTVKYMLAIKGNASRSGSDSVNLTISAKRAAAVADYLWAKVGSIAGISPLPAGESLARKEGVPDGFESEDHRSVVVGATDYPKHKPPPPPHVIRKVVVPPKYSDPRIPFPGMYTVKVLAGWEASGGALGVAAQLTQFRVEIRDLARAEFMRYNLTIGSGKIELGAPASLESVGPGEPRRFLTDPSIRVWDFEGRISFDAVSLDALKWSASYGLVSLRRDPGSSVGLGSSVPLVINFRLPVGEQRWEFGKAGVGVASGVGYLSVEK